MIRQIAASFSRWTCAAGMLAILAAGTAVSASRAQADDNRWGFGSDLGLTIGTVNGTVFTLAFNSDYYIDRNFSDGPMMQISPMGDLFQISFAGVGVAAGDGATVTKTSASEIRMLDQDGTSTIWSKPGSAWQVSSVQQAESNSTSSYSL